MNPIINKAGAKIFENIRRHNDDMGEYWSARALMRALEYKKWETFKEVINRAMTACVKSGKEMTQHFSRTEQSISIGSGTNRQIEDFYLSRYACYLIVQNGDSKKPVIANGQTYFAIQTRRQELQDDRAFQQLTEDDKRVQLRQEMREHNKLLVKTAKQAGVATHLDFAIFQNHGYKGLYDGLTAKDIHRKKQLKKSQQILDHMGSTELAANLFRATQTEEKLKRDGTKQKEAANETHYKVGKKVRETIKEIGGAMPENLPTPASGAKALEKKR